MRKRVQRGVSQGGQFAATDALRDESDVVLSEEVARPAPKKARKLFGKKFNGFKAEPFDITSSDDNHLSTATISAVDRNGNERAIESWAKVEYTVSSGRWSAEIHHGSLASSGAFFDNEAQARAKLDEYVNEQFNHEYLSRMGAWQ